MPKSKSILGVAKIAVAQQLPQPAADRNRSEPMPTLPTPLSPLPRPFLKIAFFAYKLHFFK
jgi:hypothetical protein